MNLKLIVMDMDGTLLNSEKKITPKTREKLIALEKQGVKLALASGRAKTRLEEYARELEMHRYGGYIVEANGVAVYDYQKDEHTEIRRMYVEEAEEVFAWLKKYYAEVEISVMGEVNAYIHLPEGAKESRYFNKTNMESLKNRKVIAFETIKEIPEKIAKVCVCDTEDKINQVYDSLSVMKEKYWYGRTLTTWLEICPKEISKINGVKMIQEKMNCKDDEILVFGDGENDLTMLEAYHGVLMENAIASLKEKIHEVTAGCNDDGIAKYLEKLGY